MHLKSFEHGILEALIMFRLDDASTLIPIYFLSLLIQNEDQDIRAGSVSAHGRSRIEEHTSCTVRYILTWQGWPLKRP